METPKFDFFFFFSKKFEIEFDLYFDLCWRAEINIQVGLNMHLYVDIGDASSSLWGLTLVLYFVFFIPILGLFLIFKRKIENRSKNQNSEKILC